MSRVRAATRRIALVARRSRRGTFSVHLARETFDPFHRSGEDLVRKPCAPSASARRCLSRSCAALGLGLLVIGGWPTCSGTVSADGPASAMPAPSCGLTDNAVHVPPFYGPVPPPGQPGLGASYVDPVF